jgi:hypothetical protein
MPRLADIQRAIPPDIDPDQGGRLSDHACCPTNKRRFDESLATTYGHIEKGRLN